MNSPKGLKSRVSLRRKRPNVIDSKQESFSKRISPSNETESKEEQSKLTYNEYNKDGACTSFRTPKSTRRKKPNSSKKTPSPSLLPMTRNAKKLIDNAPSPSQSVSPFTLSQLPSTQDCEVVWDCNSPGYSKEDLKGKYLNTSGPDLSSPIAPVSNLCGGFIKPKRLLELPTRVEVQNPNSVAEELDNLLTKVNVEPSKEVEDDQFTGNKQFCLDEFLDLNLLKTSSQPFEVSERSLQLETIQPKSVADNFNGKENIPDKKETSESIRNLDLEESKSTPVPSPRAEKTSDTSNFSMDEDFFNESFLQSTQALEDAFFNQCSKRNTPSPSSSMATTACRSKEKFSPRSRIQKKKPTFIPQNDAVDSSSLGDPTSNYFASKMPSRTSPLREKETKRIPEPNDLSSNESSFHQPTTQRACFQLKYPRNNNGDTHRKTYDDNKSMRDINHLEQKNLESSPPSEVIAKVNNATKLPRSVSENIGIANNSFKKCASLDLSQTVESDDDEIFASLIPSLVAVEAEHTGTESLSQCIKNSYQEDKNLAANPSEISPLKKPKLNQFSFHSDKPTSDQKNGLSRDLEKVSKNTKSILFSNVTQRIKLEESAKLTNQYHIQSKDLKSKENSTHEMKCQQSSSVAQKGKKEEDRRNVFSSVFSSKFGETSSFKGRRQHNESNQESHNSQASKSYPQKGQTEKANFNGLPNCKINPLLGVDDDDDDDDDLFLQEDVLDYISLVESQYASDGCIEKYKERKGVKTSNKEFSRPLTNVRGKCESSGTVISQRKSDSSVGGMRIKSQERSRSLDEDSNLDSSFKSSSTGLRFFVNEMEKFGAATKRVNEAIKGGAKGCMSTYR